LDIGFSNAAARPGLLVIRHFASSPRPASGQSAVLGRNALGLPGDCVRARRHRDHATQTESQEPERRISPVAPENLTTFDSERLLLRIEQGKHRKDRFAMLSPKLLELLRDWYRIALRWSGCSRRDPMLLAPVRSPASTSFGKAR
jgi:hypothetical protein